MFTLCLQSVNICKHLKIKQIRKTIESMETLTFETKDLTLEFIADLKQRFTDSVFELKIFDKTKAKVSRKRMNETDYLLSTDANRKHLERAIENVNNGNVVTYDFDEFVKEYDAKIQAAL